MSFPSKKNKAIDNSVTQDLDFDNMEVTKRIRKAHVSLVDDLLLWFEGNSRSLPWRESYEPYSVWISEVMLQQTQMERGVTFFNRWMKRFPTLESVASASLDDILKSWEGLGYYTRAKNLHETAKILVRDYNGIFPSDPATLCKLPGVGAYTAGAVAAIAFNLPVPAVDANVERVFSRLFDIAMPCKSKAASGFILQMMEALIPAKKAREFIQAIMEFGALLCKKSPLCEKCPLQKYCQAHRLGIVQERPIKGKKVQYASLQVVSGVLAHKGRIFIQKRLNSGAWAGLWEFPGGRLEQGETPLEGALREMLEETAFIAECVEDLGIVNHAYTHFKVALHCFFLRLRGPLYTEEFPIPVLEAATDYRWVFPEELETYALPAGHRKLVDENFTHIVELARSLT